MQSFHFETGHLDQFPSLGKWPYQKPQLVLDEIPWCVGLKMSLHCVALCPLLLISLSYAGAEVSPSTSLYSSSSSLPTMLSSVPQMLSESTQDPKSLLQPRPDTNSPLNSSLAQQNQTQPSVSTHPTENAELPQEEEDGLAFEFSDPNMEDSGKRPQWEVAAGDVAIVLMKPKGQLRVGEPQGAASHAMSLFLGGCGLLLCVFIGLYCAYSRGSKKEPFAHHRLYEEAFDDPALFLDSPKDYDWFFYETDGYVYPTPSQTQLKPIQILSVPALKQPSPVLEMSAEKLANPEIGSDAKELQRNTVKLECLSPSNLNLGNLI